MKLEKNVPLAPYTTMRIGGNADVFFHVETLADLAFASKYIREKKLAFFVLGGGSNVLIRDEGFHGAVIHPRLKGIKVKQLGSFRFKVEAAAGERWDDLVAYTVGQGLYGLENLSLIPGSVGAAPVQNIGAYGVELKETLESVEIFDMNDGKIKVLSNEECKFGYRDSIFKKPKGKYYIITKITLELASKGNIYIGYRDLMLRFKDVYSSKLTPKDIREAVIDIRQKKLPDPTKIGTAGSFFKNPIVTKLQFQKLKMRFPALPSFAAAGGKVKLPLAWILDKICGLGAYREGNVGLYLHQPLNVVQYGDATAVDVLRFAERVAHIIEEKTSIKPEWEVRMVE